MHLKRFAPALGLLLLLGAAPATTAAAHTGFDEKWTGTFDGDWLTTTRSTGESKKMKAKGYFKGNDVVIALVAFDNPSLVLSRWVSKGDVSVSVGQPYAKDPNDRKKFSYTSRLFTNFTNPDFKRFGGKKVKDVKVGSKTCAVYDYDVLGQTGRHHREDTICDGWFPAHITMTDYPLPGIDSAMTLSNLKLGVDVPADLYEVPPDYTAAIPIGPGSSADNPVIIARPLAGGEAAMLPPLPPGLTYCAGAQPTTMGGMDSLKDTPGAAAMASAMQMISLTCDGAAGDVAKFFSQQLEQQGWVLSKKVAERVKDLPKTLRESAKTMPRDQRGSVMYFVDAADAGNLQYLTYLSPKPKIVTVMGMIAPGFQNEGKNRTSVMLMIQDMGIMLKGMPDSILDNVRKAYE